MTKVEAIVNGKNVTITLTKDQLAEIAKQTSGIRSIEDIDGIKEAEEVLKNCSSHKKKIKSDFKREKDWYAYQLETIIKAANYLDNNKKEWKPEFNGRDYNYIPWMEKKSSGWFPHFVYYCYSSSCCPSWLYYKKEETARLFCKKHQSLYNQYLG